MRYAIVLILAVLGGCVTVEYAPLPPAAFPEQAPPQAVVPEPETDDLTTARSVAVGCMSLYVYAQRAFEAAGEFEAAARLTPYIDWYSEVVVRLGLTAEDPELQEATRYAMVTIRDNGLVETIDQIGETCRDLAEEG